MVLTINVSLKNQQKGTCTVLTYTPAVVNEYLKTELNQNRVTDPFTPLAVTGGHIRRFGIMPKHHQRQMASNSGHILF